MKASHKGIFITGTDTDVGKTYVTALLLKKLREEGINAIYFKAALSGAQERNGELIPGDAEYVSKLSGLDEDYKNIVSYSFKTAVSPHLAAALEGEEVCLDKILKDYNKLYEKYDFVVAEGSGGIICPLKITEDESLFLEDVIKALGYEVIVVARSGVGTINHTVLTVEHLKKSGINIKAIIFNEFDKTSRVHQDNVKVIQKLTGINTVFYVPTFSTGKDEVIEFDTSILF